MALRVSGKATGNTVDVSAVTNREAADRSGIAHAEELLSFADAVVAGGDAVAMATARQSVLERLGAEQLVDVAAVASNFQRMVRIADSTGIPIDGPMEIISADLRSDLGLDGFGSAANTPKSGFVRRAIGAVVRPIALPLMHAASKRMRLR